MTTYSCELAWVDGQVESGVVIDVDGDRIAAVLSGASDPPADAVALAGLTLPGLANAHSHVFQRAMRSRTHTGAESFWTWREQMYELADRLTPDTYHRLARATFAEMALAGVATVGEFHYLHHPGAMTEAVLAAATEAGIRITLLDALYLHGGLQRFRDDDFGSWAARVDRLEVPGGALVGAAAHSVRAVDPHALGQLGRWASAQDAPLHVHLSEQPAENEATRAAHGCSPTELLAAAGLLGVGTTAVHATHLSPADVALLGEAGAGICFCPTTERDLADGIGPAHALVEAGATLSLGSDSHAVIDLFEEARAVELNERLASGIRGRHQPASLLAMATVNGHGALGWRDAGELRVGALADLVTIDLGSVRLAGLDAATAASGAVFAATAADVRHVVVGGRCIVRDGAHRTIDVASELDASIEELR